MDSITTGGLTFRWADDHLVITTPKGQYMLDAQGAAHLLDMLYAQKDEILTPKRTRMDSRLERVSIQGSSL